MDWRKFDLVEYRKGRYRLERQTWDFWDWAFVLIVGCILFRFWWVALIVGLGLLLATVGATLAGVALAWLSRK